MYDQDGEVKRDESFDVDDADFEQRVAAAKQAYAEKGSPVLEMLSLAEYVENPDAAWREADLSGQFNLRNQQQRDAERERLKPALHLTRNTAIEALQSKSSPQEPLQLGASSVPMESSKFESPPVEEQASSTKWVMAVAVVTAALGLLCLLFKKRK